MYLFCFFLEFLFRGASSEFSALHTRWFTCVSLPSAWWTGQGTYANVAHIVFPILSVFLHLLLDRGCFLFDKNVSRVPDHVGDRIDLGPEGPTEVITYKAQ